MEQVDDYLAAAGEPLASVRTAVQQDEVLQELAQSPLTLSIMTLAYQGVGPEQLEEDSLTERRDHLFATYVQRMFERRGNTAAYTPEQAQQWLSYLAWQMAERSQTVFFIERLQIDWLLSYDRQRRTKILSGLIVGLVGGLGLGLFVGMVGGMGIGLGVGLFVWLGFGLVGLVGWLAEIEIVETVTWSGYLLGRMLVLGLVGWLLVGQGVGLAGWLGVGLFGGLFGGLKRKELESKTVPNQGIHLSARNALRIGLGVGLGVGLVSELVGWLVGWLAGWASG